MLRGAAEARMSLRGRQRPIGGLLGVRWYRMWVGGFEALRSPPAASARGGVWITVSMRAREELDQSNVCSTAAWSVAVSNGCSMTRVT